MNTHLHRSRSRCSPVLAADAPESTDPTPLTTSCPSERFCPVPGVTKGTYVPALFNQHRHRQNYTALLDKPTGATLWCLGHTRSLAWHSPAALLTALPARSVLEVEERITERMYVSVPTCHALWVDCSSGVWEKETGRGWNRLRSGEVLSCVIRLAFLLLSPSQAASFCLKN